MAEQEVKEGDAVSWQWSGGRPGGEVAEVKEQGKVEMVTKNNNVVTKDGEPGNPAVKIERSGHDVVKKASEIAIEEKGDKHKGGEDKDKPADDEEKKDDGKDEGEKKANGDAATGDKRKAEDSAEDKKAEEEGDDSKKQKQDEEAKANGEAPKKKGRPPKSDSTPKKEAKKREPKKAATETGEPRRSSRQASKSS